MTLKEYLNNYNYENFAQRDLGNDTLYFFQSFEKDTIELFQSISDTECERVTKNLISHADRIPDEKIFMRIYLYSIMINLRKDKTLLDILLKDIMSAKVLDGHQKYYLWNQIKRLLFTIPELSTVEINEKIRLFYREIYQQFRYVFSNMLAPIPKEQRQKENVVVFTSQVLSERHAPTHTALERCYTLQKNMGKKVCLINTKEQLTSLSAMPFFHQCIANRIESLNSVRQLNYKDTSFAFYQAQGDMPTLEETLRILQLIANIKPYLIINIGGGSLVSDLCSNLIPTASIATVFSELPTTEGQFSVIGRKLSQSEWEGMEKTGRLGGVIESTFSFELKPQLQHYSRKDFNLPEEAFLCAIVGTRLDSDMSAAFIESLHPLFDWNIHLLFAGYFEDYNAYCDKYPYFASYSTFVGYCEDILALMELCDLYINPPRFGGGFSVVEAMYQKKPAVSLAYGDVATAAGSEFCVKDLDEMKKMIYRYRYEKEFYEKQANKAYERALVVTDAYQPLKEIITQIENSPSFF